MGLGIPPRKIEILIESSPLESVILVLYGDWPYLKVLYWENIEGGHGGAADNIQRAYMWAPACKLLASQGLTYLSEEFTRLAETRLAQNTSNYLIT